jgi:hypothetical protein
MKTIKFMDKEYKDIKEFNKFISKYDYMEIKKNNIIISMSLEEFQKELEEILNFELKERLTPLYEELKEQLEDIEK